MGKQPSEGGTLVSFALSFLLSLVFLVLVIGVGSFWTWAGLVFFGISALGNFHELNSTFHTFNVKGTETVLFFCIGLAIIAFCVFMIIKCSGNWIYHNVFHWYTYGGLVAPYEWDTDYNWLKIFVYPLLIGGVVLGIYICIQALKEREEKNKMKSEDITTMEPEQCTNVVSHKAKDFTRLDVENMIREMTPLPQIKNVILSVAQYNWETKYKVTKYMARDCMINVLSIFNMIGYPQGFKDYVFKYEEYFDLTQDTFTMRNDREFKLFLKKQRMF